ncbi:MAG TPA: PilZ domain-containing protein [Phycisphaerales bacterium]|nr:PilZ domain-containing protein [Phycisphaerales bacterium]
MLNKLLNKIFNKDRGPTPRKKSGDSQRSQESVPAEAPRPRNEAVIQSNERNLDIPNRLDVGMALKAVPENLKGKPRAWDVEIVKLDLEGIWVMRTQSDDEPVPAEKGKLLSLVLMENDKTITYDCPVIRIEQGVKEEILVAPPVKTLQEESQLRNMGARKHLRISFRLPAEIRRVQGSDLGPPVSAHTKDISMSGLALESATHFDKGEEIDIRILSWNFPLQVRAFVVRCFPQDGKNTVAVTFPPDLSTVSSDLISQFILENQRR